MADLFKKASDQIDNCQDIVQQTPLHPQASAYPSNQTQSLAHNPLLSQSSTQFRPGAMNTLESQAAAMQTYQTTISNTGASDLQIQLSS